MAIVHTHGPKPEMSLCVIEYLRHDVANKLAFEPKHVIHRKSEIAQHCGIQVRQAVGQARRGTGVACRLGTPPPFPPPALLSAVCRWQCIWTSCCRLRLGHSRCGAAAPLEMAARHGCLPLCGSVRVTANTCPQADDGAVYRWVLQEHDRLCPGACWARMHKTKV